MDRCDTFAVGMLSTAQTPSPHIAHVWQGGVQVVPEMGLPIAINPASFMVHLQFEFAGCHLFLG